MKIVDRYVLRQVVVPFAIGLLVFTFLLIIQPMMRYAEEYISKGVPLPVVAQMMATLLPQALGMTIPMSLLLGLLVAFGRLSADREFVALQACGVSLTRLLRPVGLVAIAAFAASLYVLLVLVPAGNQRFLDITFNIIASRAEGEVKPRIFFEDFPNVVLYVREVPQAGGWNGVFMADNRSTSGPDIYLARHGRVIIDRPKKTVDLVLEDGARHKGDVAGKYEVIRFQRQIISLDPETVFSRGTGAGKGVREMSVPELEARVAQLRAEGTYPHNELFEIYKRFSLPAACLVFGLIGLALGATNRRDGQLASFVLGVVVIMTYYVVFQAGYSLNKGQLIPPWLAAWSPNIVLGLLGVMLFKWRGRVADQPLRLPVPEVFRRWSTARPHLLPRGLRSMRLPFSILDRYVVATYARALFVSAAALAALFYIATFLDLSEKVLKGDATWAMFGTFMWNMTPQYVYYIVPLSVLLATLVTISLLTKNSELIVMKACGISLYRVAWPMVIASFLAAGVLFTLEQTVLGPSNRKAEELRHIMRGRDPNVFGVLSRRWMVGTEGDIYNYNAFDPEKRHFIGLSVYEFTGEMGRVARRTFAQTASYDEAGVGRGLPWVLESGWTREFDDKGEPSTFSGFQRTRQALEPPAHFTTEIPDPQFMTYSQLRGYTERLMNTGVDVIRQQVELARKVSFPFVTLVMTLIAVPFAVTIGRSGAMAGIGIGIAIAVIYWTTSSVFAAMGAGGALSPALAAWAPNLLFGAGATYLLLTVRT